MWAARSMGHALAPGIAPDPCLADCCHTALWCCCSPRREGRELLRFTEPGRDPTPHTPGSLELLAPERSERADMHRSDAVTLGGLEGPPDPLPRRPVGDATLSRAIELIDANEPRNPKLPSGLPPTKEP